MIFTGFSVIVGIKSDSKGAATYRLNHLEVHLWEQDMLKEARSDGKHALSLRAVDRIVKQIELQARLLGEI